MATSSLRSDQLKTVEQLVAWKAGVKFINYLVGSDDGGKIARDIYKNFNERPPSGQSGAAIASRISPRDLMSYTALATRYLAVRRLGIPQDQAATAVYSCATRKTMSPDTGTINRWLGLARDLEVGNAGIFKCPNCDGNHLWQSGASRLHSRCLWCNAEITMPATALKAAQSNKIFMGR